MVLFWRGWGLAVFWTFIFWFLAGIVLVIVAAPYQPDAHKAGLDVQWGIAGLFALNAASVFALAWYRKSHPQQLVDQATGQTVLVPRDDSFMFLRLDLWPYILLVVAAFFAVASQLGYEVLAQ